MPEKTHRTAIVQIPPERVWKPIQEIRRIHDRQARRWMPHVTLLYPFRPRPELEGVVPILEERARSIAPFRVTLRGFCTFRHRRSAYTLWLRPEPEEEMKRLQAHLVRAFPDCNDTARFPGGFHPHLSVGQFRGSRDDLHRLLEDIGSTWSPPEFRADAVHLIARGAPPDDVFRVIHEVRLGAG